MQNPAQIEEQDLITPEAPEEGDPAVIRVNNVNNANPDRPAIYCENSNASDDARALKAVGIAEVTRLVVNTRADMGGIIVLTNPGSINMDGVLDISGDITTDPATKPVIKVNDVNTGNDAKIALHTINSSTVFRLRRPGKRCNLRASHFTTTARTTRISSPALI
jgi:hypothetical protein